MDAAGQTTVTNDRRMAERNEGNTRQVCPRKNAGISMKAPSSPSERKRVMTRGPVSCRGLNLRPSSRCAYSCGAVAEFHRLPEHPGDCHCVLHPPFGGAEERHGTVFHDINFYSREGCAKSKSGRNQFRTRHMFAALSVGFESQIKEDE